MLSILYSTSTKFCKRLSYDRRYQNLTVLTTVRSRRCATTGKIAIKEVKQENSFTQERLEELILFIEKRTWASLWQMNSVINYLNSFETLPSRQTAFFLKCCGHMTAFEENEKRIQLTETMWKIVKKSPLKIDHFNLKLQVCTENNQIIDVESFLKEISDAGLKKNGTTYFNLLMYYCENGNVEKMVEISEHLKKKGVIFNEKMYNSIMLGHHRAKDIDAALKTFVTMKSEQIPIGRLTYETLLQIYSEMNNESATSSILSKVSGFSIKQKSLLNAHYHFLKNKNKTFAEEIFSLLPNDILTKNIGPAVIRTLQINEYEVAYRISLLELNRVNNFKHAFFPKLLTRYASVDVVSHYCGKMVTSKINILAFQDSLFIYLTKGNIENAITILKEMTKMNVEIKEHYLYPLICLLLKEKLDIEKLAEILQLDPRLSPDIYYLYVFPLLSQWSDPLEAINQLDELLPNNSYRQFGLFIHLLKINRFEDGVNLMLDKKILFSESNTNIFYEICYSYMRNPHCVKSFAKLAFKLIYPVDYSARNFSRITKLLKCLKSVYHNTAIGICKADKEEYFLKFLQSLSEYGIKISTTDATDLKMNFFNTSAIKHCIDNMTYVSLISWKNTCKFHKDPSYESFHENRLKNEISIYRKQDTLPPSKMIELLLEKYALEGLHDKMLALYKEAESSDLELSYKCYFSMARSFYNHEEYYYKIHIMRRLYKNFPAVKVSEMMILQYAESLIITGEIKDATDVILTNICDESRCGENINQTMSRIFKSLDNVSCDLLVEEFKNALVKKGYSLKDFMVNPQSEIMEFINKNQMEKAIQVFVKLQEDENKLFSQEALLTKCISNIEENNSSRNRSQLDFVYNFITRFKGKAWADNQLAYAYISLGHLQYARNIFEKRDFRVNMHLLREALHKIHLNGCSEKFNELLDISMNSTPYTRRIMYEVLINFCHLNKYETKKLEIINLAIEEKIDLNSSLLNT